MSCNGVIADVSQGVAWLIRTKLRQYFGIEGGGYEIQEVDGSLVACKNGELVMAVKPHTAMKRSDGRWVRTRTARYY